MVESYLDGIFLVFEEYPLLLLHVVTSVVTTLAFNLCWKLWCKRTQKEIGKTIYSEKCPTDNKVTKKVVADFPEVFITGRGRLLICTRIVADQVPEENRLSTLQDLLLHHLQEGVKKFSTSLTQVVGSSGFFGLVL